MQKIKRVKSVFSKYIEQLPELKEHCDRCLRTERWGGNVLLMILDASFTSIGLNYFNTVVPKVLEFRDKYIKTGLIVNLEDFLPIDIMELKKIWRNERSLHTGREITAYLVKLKGDMNLSNDRETLRVWARGADLDNWMRNPIGRIRGVGINTFQYLRMMGGIDTVMPDKIVKRVITHLLKEAGEEIRFSNDIEFVKVVHGIASKIGYRPIELCWMTWLIQREGELLRMEKYREILKEI
jgi:hypothetical protein